MPSWYKTKYTYTQVVDDSTVGTRNEEFVKQKTISETLLVDAVSFTDAEARTYEEAGSLHDIDVTHAARVKLSDVFRHDTGSIWHLAKVAFITEDEKTGKQKKVKSRILVNADTPKEAYDRVEAALKSALDPFEITDVDGTDILEVVEYTKERKIFRALQGVTISSEGITVEI